MFVSERTTVSGMPPSRLWVVAIAAMLLLPRLVLGTDGIEPIGVSAQSRMRGGADVAVGDSALSQIDNPGTLSLSPRGMYSLDEASKLAIIDLSWRAPLGTAESSTRLIHLHNVGFADPINDRLTLGLALHSKAGVGTSFNQRHLLIPWMKRQVGSDMKDMAVVLSGAYKVTEKLSLGLGARVEVATAEFSKVLGPADIDFGRGYAYGGGFQAGLHYKATDTLHFGLAYRSPTWFGDLAGGSAKASLLGLLPVPLGDAGLRISSYRKRSRPASPGMPLIGSSSSARFAGSITRTAPFTT
jgi:long-chain fatty acid transport protein